MDSVYKETYDKSLQLHHMKGFTINEFYKVSDFGYLSTNFLRIQRINAVLLISARNLTVVLVLINTHLGLTVIKMLY